ncbi:MAG: flavodoxin [Bacteroidales bacterium]
MEKTAIIYSFNTLKTARAAKLIHASFGDENIEMVNAEEITGEKFLQYKNLILGVPTWFDGELPNYWDEFIPELEELDLMGRRIAIFGPGDQKGYPENFVDGIGILGSLLEKRGGKLVGFTPAEGYTFEKSLALRGENFMGLPLDFENQASKNNERIRKWVEQLKNEFAL